jgi:DNA-binding transcriptional ArsR family regulator
MGVAGNLLVSPGWEGENGPFATPGPRAEPSADATQDRILDYVTRHPGVYLRQICRELGLAMGDVQYHVHRLEKERRISSSRRGFYRFFYPSGLFGDRQKDILGVLSLDTPRELLLQMLAAPGSGQDALVRAVGVSQPTVSWHLKRLIDLGIVQKEQVGRNAVYRVVGGGAADIALFMMNYHPTVWEKWSGRLADIFITYSTEEQEGETRK